MALSAFIHRVNPGMRGSQAKLCYDHSVLLNGYSLIPDAGQLPSKTALRERILRAYPDNTNRAAGNRSGYLWIFFHEMRPGDLVITPEEGRLHIARIEGEPYFTNNPGALSSDTAHRIPVTWLTQFAHPIDPALASAELEKAASPRGTTRSIPHLRADVEALLASAGIVPENQNDLDALVSQQIRARDVRSNASSREMRQTMEQVARRNAQALVADAPDDDVIVQEGTVRYALHRMRERDRTNVARKKQSVLEQHGCLACEVCAFDFAVAWPGLGDEFIECHHLRHLSEGATETKLSDLALVCANCHRMFHRLPSGTTVRELRRGSNGR